MDMATDTICGMTVDEATALHAERGGKLFYFCSEHCREKYLSQNAPAKTDGGCCGGAKAKPASDSGDCCGGKSEHEHGAEEHSCCGCKAEPASVTGDCCGGHEHHGHSHHGYGDATVKPSSAAKYFCPMCPGVESDEPRDCPKCGMALERNPAWVSPATGKVIYTCPMHPEIKQDHPGNCPKCGMALEPKTV